MKGMGNTSPKTANMKEPTLYVLEDYIRNEGFSNRKKNKNSRAFPINKISHLPAMCEAVEAPPPGCRAGPPDIQLSQPPSF